MSLTNYTNSRDSQGEEGSEEEIFQFIQDERVLRVLFEQKIFKLRQIQKEAIQKGLFFRKSFCFLFFIFNIYEHYKIKKKKYKKTHYIYNNIYILFCQL